MRYATDAVPPSLFVSADAAALRRLHPDNQRLQQLGKDDRLVVSEPFNDLPGAWNEIDPLASVVVTPDGDPLASVVVTADGRVDHRPFRPQPPGS